MNSTERDNNYFSNRPLENNLDYLKKNDSISEVNWEGTETEFKNNSALHMCFSNPKPSVFKMNSMKDEENNSNNHKIKSPEQLLKENSGGGSGNTPTTTTEIHKQLQSNRYNNNENDQINQKKIDLISSPLNEKTQPCEMSTNHASHTQEQNVIFQTENNNKEMTPTTNLINQQGNLKVDDLHIDINPKNNTKSNASKQNNNNKNKNGDSTPSRSPSPPNQRKYSSEKSSSRSNKTGKQNNQLSSKSEKENNHANKKENNNNDKMNEGSNEERPKMFKFKTQLESVHEVENWKDYNRENSKEHKTGCTCNIF